MRPSTLQHHRSCHAPRTALSSIIACNTLMLQKHHRRVAIIQDRRYRRSITAAAQHLVVAPLLHNIDVTEAPPMHLAVIVQHCRYRRSIAATAYHHRCCEPAMFLDRTQLACGSMAPSYITSSSPHVCRNAASLPPHHGKMASSPPCVVATLVTSQQRWLTPPVRNMGDSTTSQQVKDVAPNLSAARHTPTQEPVGVRTTMVGC